MRSKRLLFLAGSIGLLLAACLAMWLTTRQHRVNPESYEKIQNGMTEKQVEDVFGVPRGDYSTGPPVSTGALTMTAQSLMVGGDPAPLPGTTLAEWRSDEAIITIWFDQAGRVSGSMCLECHRPREPLLAKLRRWLGL